MPVELARIARYQAGMVSRRQAVEIGLPRTTVVSRVRRGRWQPVYPGVYATFTGVVGRNAQLWAAVLYAGAEARLSHESAAEVLRLTDRQSRLIHVTIPGKRRVVAQKGVVIHRSSCPGRYWRPALEIPPHTFAEDTILDLAEATGDLDEVVGWVTAAFNARLTSESHLRHAMTERQKLRWRGQLDQVVSMAGGGAHSVLEFRYDRDVERAHGLPAAKKQVPFTKPDGSKGFRDRFYDEYGLVVELDGRRFHDGRRDQDRCRDNDAVATTGATLRYTWDDVTREPCVTAAQVHAALRGRGHQGALRPCSPRCRAVTVRAAS